MIQTPVPTDVDLLQQVDGATHQPASALEDICPTECRRDFRSAVRVVLPLLPFVAVIVTVLLYCAPVASGGQFAPILIMDSLLLTGIVWTIGLGWAAAVFYYWFQGTAADHANARSYSELCQRLRGVHARSLVAPTDAQTAPQRGAYGEALTYIAALRRELARPGLRWVLGIGYINAWNLVHRAEEAMVELEPPSAVLRGGEADLLKIQGSAIGGSTQPNLLERLQQALQVIEAAATSAALPQAQPSSASNPLPTPSNEVDARATLREMRHTVNDFRDDRWDGLVRARNHLLAALAVTGVFTFLLLALALSGHGPASGVGAAAALQDPIFAAAGFYLVGAVVGLFKRLSDEADSAADVEDYGLGTARLLLTPVLSGLAAVGGAFIVGMVPALVNGQFASNPPNLSSIFVLGQNPYGLVFAAIFGLSPSLLISAIGKAADQYKLDIRNSEAAQSPPR